MTVDFRRGKFKGNNGFEIYLYIVDIEYWKQ